MIKAFIFDLDGTLVQTEALKAKSYARAAVELDGRLTEDEVIAAFKDYVGLSRKEVAEGLLERFNLGAEAAARMKEFGVSAPWQAFVEIRLKTYFQMISDPEILKQHLCPYNSGLLKKVRAEGYPTGLGTMSHREEAYRVMDVLGITDDFDFVATIEDVDRGKPDPEIYNLLAGYLGIEHYECLVVEDSASGVKAALAARMYCMVVTTDYTRAGVHALPPSPAMKILDDAARLIPAVDEFMRELSGARESAG